MSQFSIREEINQDDFRLYFVVKEYEPLALQKTSDIFQKAFIVRFFCLSQFFSILQFFFVH